MLRVCVLCKKSFVNEKLFLLRCRRRVYWFQFLLLFFFILIKCLFLVIFAKERIFEIKCLSYYVTEITILNIKICFEMIYVCKWNLRNFYSNWLLILLIKKTNNSSRLDKIFYDLIVEITLLLVDYILSNFTSYLYVHNNDNK